MLSGALPKYRSMGEEEKRAVMAVIDADCLSGFYGSWGDEFFGGPRIQELEKAWAEKFKIRHAVSVNSATSGLVAAMGAIGISPGDEVIVPPYTMSATAMAPIVYGGIPVFADIEADTFCLGVTEAAKAITQKTRAIIAVNLFGHPAQLAELRALADAHGLKLVEDNAQAPLATENGCFAGTVGHIGVFSLNYHKHIHTGEGGICVTDDDDLACRLQMIRNHGENVVEPLQIRDLTNMVGFNLRMTELSAAVGIVQLKNAEKLVGARAKLALYLSQGVVGLEGLLPPVVRPGCRHVYYLWGLRYDAEQVGVSRDVFSRALAAEGFPHFNGYVRPLYHLPVFQKRQAIGREGFPFNLATRIYSGSTCPVAERMHTNELICFETCAHAVDDGTAAQLVEALQKVHKHRHELVE